MAVQGDEDALEPARASASARAATATFCVVVAVALPLLMYWGRRYWFVIDDWDFLAFRAGESPRDLFRAHAGHWTTLPVIVYRVLWKLVGIRSYGAYLSVLIVVHLATAILLRTIMRRAGVGPWLATAFAAVFVFLGSGSANIVIAFQITFAGSLMFGFAHLLLALHPGPIERRDFFGLLCGLAALMCSGVGIAMLIAVGIATLLRRGYRAALLHTAPLVGVYLVWFAAIGRDGAPRTSGLTASGAFRFAVQGIEAAFGGIGRLDGVGLLYFLMLLVGAVLLIFRHRVAPISDGAAAALGLLAAALFFVGSTAATRSAPLAGATRSFAEQDARAGRYVYVIVALLLPVLALAAQAIIHAWRPAAVLVGAMLLVSFAGNIHTFSKVPGDASVAQGVRRHVLTVPRLPMAPDLPPALLVVPGLVPVKMEWLADAARAGKLASPGRLSATDISSSTLLLMVRASPKAGKCRQVTAPIRFSLRPRQALVVTTGAVTVSYEPSSGSASRPAFVSRGRPVYNVFTKPVRLNVERIPRSGAVSLCVATPPGRRTASPPR